VNETDPTVRCLLPPSDHRNQEVKAGWSLRVAIPSHRAFDLCLCSQTQLERVLGKEARRRSGQVGRRRWSERIVGLPIWRVDANLKRRCWPVVLMTNVLDMLDFLRFVLVGCGEEIVLLLDNSGRRCWRACIIKASTNKWTGRRRDRAFRREAFASGTGVNLLCIDQTKRGPAEDRAYPGLLIPPGKSDGPAPNSPSTALDLA